MPAVKCWSCGSERASGDALCPACGKVQPPPPAGEAQDRFAFLGFPRAFELDADRVEEAFRALSRKLHPDRFARASVQERRFSLEQTTRLNEAYRTVKDPVRRAEHLLQLRGVKIAGEGRDQLRMDPGFLERMMADREKLLEAKMDGSPSAVQELAEGVRAQRDETLSQVRELLAQEPLDGDRAAELLARMRYFARYLDEVEGRAPGI